MVVDFQSHIFPDQYLDEIRRVGRGVVLEHADPYSGLSYFYDQKLGCRINTATFHGRDPEVRIRHMDNLGIDVQVLSVPPPGADRFEGEDAVAIAKKANEALADLCQRYPSRFVGLCTLPTSSVKASLDELDRSIQDLGLRGFGCYSNLNGRPLDSEELFPLYERIARYHIPIYIHPTAPLATQAVGLDIMPVLIYGWAFDSTVAMTRLVYGRVVERFPEIHFVVADVGGVLAFFAQRARNIYTGRTAEIEKRYGLKVNPLDSFRRFYVDTADHPASTLRCALDFFGPDRLVLGTNYPYGPEEGCILVKNSLSAVEQLDLPQAEKQKILGLNAAAVLRLEAS
ncbi:MAG TPA: amidohydrolase family protein [Candidatus Binatia bacterium]|jgi:aminocarboxymuconate-semialdehyde decarboxylase|nr:amidohydrolase family protein [Candidatus Binatia bacterium]